MRIPATSRQYVTVPAALLTARPGKDPVSLALITDDGTEPGPADWRGTAWLVQGGTMLGAGLLLGPGSPVTLPAGTYRIWVAEFLQDATAPVWPWDRLTIGTGAP